MIAQAIDFHLPMDMGNIRSGYLKGLRELAFSTAPIRRVSSVAIGQAPGRTKIGCGSGNTPPALVLSPYLICSGVKTDCPAFPKELGRRRTNFRTWRGGQNPLLILAQPP